MATTTTLPDPTSSSSLPQDGSGSPSMNRVKLTPVWATGFSRKLCSVRGYAEADPTTPTGLATLQEWHEASVPVWLELALPDDPALWFEGVADPWCSIETPEIDWSDVEPALKKLAVITKDIAKLNPKDDLQARSLTMLPHVYALGTARVRSELNTREKTQDHGENSLLVFPTVGFLPEQSDPSRDGAGAGTSYWIVRTCVGIVGRVVVTVRLPDLLCPGTPDVPRYRSPLDADLPIPRRFFAGRFPQLSDGPEVEHIAEAIAMHHAATARAAAERSRAELREAERKAGVLEARNEIEGARGYDPLEALRRLERVSEAVEQMDRQLSRELRRLADFEQEMHRVARHAEMRYQFALDEIRSVRTELDTGRAAIASSVQAREQKEREKFQFIATLLASAILIPTLVAAIYGANVKLPGERDWTGLIALLLFVLSFAVLGVLAVYELWKGAFMPHERWRTTGRVRALGLGVGGVAFVLGLVAAF